MKGKDILKIISVPVFFASLCCLSPVLIVLFGLGSVAFAASLADVFYGEYKWVFRGVGLILLVLSLVWYFRRKKICTLSDIAKHRRTVINTIIITLAVSVVGYIVFLYVIVHYLGVWLKIWS